MYKGDRIRVIGAGLSGSEASLTLAKFGFQVDLFEMRPKKMTGAHKTDKFGEFVCSNSLGSYALNNASGLLKAELTLLGSFLIDIAKSSMVEAGTALAVDREEFSEKVTKKIKENPNIRVIKEEFKTIDKGIPTIIASGPLTSEALVEQIKELTCKENLYFFDAIAPIVEKESINFDKAFFQNRYDKGKACYINCPMNHSEYEKFYDFLINAPRIELKDFEKDKESISFFEGCMPIEIIASRGKDTLRFGPLKPIGLIDKRTGIESYATVQLRQDNKAKTLYNLVGFQTNLKWSAQKELLQLIPGLENANIVKYGVMHKNTFINSPKLLNNHLQLKSHPNIFFCGQITGTEGYTEAIATGLFSALNIIKHIRKEPLISLPSTTMLGALINYISFEQHKKFQPINSNWGIIDNLENINKNIRKDKKLKNELLAKRSLQILKNILSINSNFLNKVL